MAVAVDATGTTATGGSVTTFDFTGITVGSGSNRALIYMIYFAGGAAVPTGITVNWDQLGTPQAMTSLKTQTLNTNELIAIYGLRNPTAGNKTLRATWTNAQTPTSDAISFTGVDQVSDATAFPNANNNSGVSTAASISITSATNNIPVVTGGTGNAFTVPNQTVIFHNGAGVGDHVGQRAAGAASVSFTSTNGAATNWAYVGCDVAQVAVTDVLASQIWL